MSSQNQGVILSSASEPPMRRKRGRPRKDEIVQVDNSPASEILNKNKHNVETSDSASDDMVGQMVSGVIEGSFDAGYLLNVKVGETNTHLRGIVFLPGRFTPITATNDVAPQAKMYRRKEIPFHSVSPQGHLHPVSPISGKSEKSVEHRNDTPKPLDQGQRIGLQCGATAANESQSASTLIPPASNLPINDTGLPLEQKDLQDILTDIGLQNSKSVGFEAFKLMKTPNNNVDAPKAPEPVPAMFTSSSPVIETVNPKPQVEHQAVSSEKLVGDAKSLDFVNDQKPNDPDPEPQAMPRGLSGINMLVKQASKFSELETQVMPCETTGINMFGKQASKFSELETQVMPCETPGINMFGKQASKFPKSEHQVMPMFGKQAYKFPEQEPQAMQCEPAGINMFGKQAPKFPEPEQPTMPCEPTRINMFGKQTSKFPETEHQATPCEPAGIDMFGKQASRFPEPEHQAIPSESAGLSMFGKQASKFPEPQAMPSEPTGINIFWRQTCTFHEPEPQGIRGELTGMNMFGKQASKFPEPQAMPCESTGINIFGKQASKFPEPESQPLSCEPTGLNMFGNQASKFHEPEPQAIMCEPTGISMFGKQASRFPEPQAMPCEATGINMFGKQASQFPELQAIPREPTGINMFGKQASQFPEPQEHTGINMFRNQASQFPGPQSITCEPTGIDMFGKQASIDVSQDTQLELASKMMTGVDVPHTDVLFASDVATTTGTAACSESMTNLPIMIFGAGNKAATEESGLPRMVVPEVSSPSIAINTNSVESNVKDAIPPEQS